MIKDVTPPAPEPVDPAIGIHQREWAAQVRLTEHESDMTLKFWRVAWCGDGYLYSSFDFEKAKTVYEAIRHQAICNRVLVYRHEHIGRQEHEDAIKAAVRAERERCLEAVTAWCDENEAYPPGTTAKIMGKLVRHDLVPAIQPEED